MFDLTLNLGENPSRVVAFERRAWVRFDTCLEASCHAAGSRRDVGWAGRVVNLSVGGVGLLMRHRFRPGTHLSVEVKTATGTLLRAFPVRVVHATAVQDGNCLGWLLGCTFAGLLPVEELEALLRAED